MIAGVTFTGWSVGMLAELLINETPPGSVSDVLSALMLAPVTTLYADVLLGQSVLSPIIGCSFWPVWLAIVVRWVRTPQRVTLVLLLLWCSVGFFRPILKLGMLMSV